MSDKDLGKALLQVNALGLAGVADARQQTWQVLERDRRRVRLWIGVTVVLWLLAALWIVFVLVTFGLLLPMQAKLLQDPDKVEQRFSNDPEKAKAAARLREPVMMHLILQKLVINITAAVAVLTLAALSTLFLVLASRRATLRQVNASLLEISEQLKLLRPAASPPNT